MGCVSGTLLGQSKAASIDPGVLSSLIHLENLESDVGIQYMLNGQELSVSLAPGLTSLVYIFLIFICISFS